MCARHDVDDVYELLDSTNRTVTAISTTQRRHGNRPEEIQQAQLDTKLDAILNLRRWGRP